MPIIAENGAYIACGGIQLAATPLDRQVVAAVISLFRDNGGETCSSGVVMCGSQAAYVERADEAFLAEVGKYFVELFVVDDLLSVSTDVLKIAVFDFSDASYPLSILQRFRLSHQVVASGPHWVDVVAQNANKGTAVRFQQRRFGTSPAQTIVFGDYVNDLEMLDTADHSFAIANAHAAVLDRARHVAPSLVEHGVITTLRGVFG